MKRGFALVIVLAILMMLSLGLAAILTAVSSHSGVKIMSAQEIKAQYLAEAGMKWAMWDCKTTPANCGVNRTSPPLDGVTTASIEKVSLGGGKYQFKVTVNY